MKRTLLAALLAAVLAPAAAQTPSTDPKAAQPAEPQTKPRAPLKLRLEEAEPRPRVTFTPKDDGKKDDAASTLPGLGGTPSRTWERPPSAIVPKDMNPGM
jgi:hypothetical protein